MGAIREAFNRVRSFFHKQQRDSDLDAELQTHIELAVEENIQPRHVARRSPPPRPHPLRRRPAGKGAATRSPRPPLARHSSAGPPLHLPHPSPRLRLHHHRHPHPRSRHRRQHRCLLRRRHHPAAPAPIPRSEPPGPHRPQSLQVRSLLRHLLHRCRPGVPAPEQILLRLHRLRRLHLARQLEAHRRRRSRPRLPDRCHG